MNAHKKISPSNYHEKVLQKKEEPPSDELNIILPEKDQFNTGLIYTIQMLGDDEKVICLFAIDGDKTSLPHVTAMVKMALSFALKTEANSAEVLRQINAALAQAITTVHIVHSLIAIYDFRMGILRCTGAGEVSINISTNRQTYPALFHGTALGIFPEAIYHEISYHLMSEDTFTLSIGNQKECTIKGEIVGPARIEHYQSLFSMENEKKLKMRTIRDFDDMAVLIDQISAEVDGIGYSIRFIKRLRLVLIELFTNAIIHGNRYDAGKKVVILTAITAEYVCVGVKDEGIGYHESDIPNPLLPENIGKPHGRGLLIIRHYAAEFSLRCNGSCAIVRLDRPKKKD